jgi:hypothetical protein
MAESIMPLNSDHVAWLRGRLHVRIRVRISARFDVRFGAKGGFELNLEPIFLICVYKRLKWVYDSELKCLALWQQIVRVIVRLFLHGFDRTRVDGP